MSLKYCVNLEQDSTSGNGVYRCRIGGNLGSFLVIFLGLPLEVCLELCLDIAYCSALK